MPALRIIWCIPPSPPPIKNPGYACGGGISTVTYKCMRKRFTQHLQRVLGAKVELISLNS